MISRSLEYPIDALMMKSVIQEFLGQRERLERLKRSYHNKREILERRRNRGLPNVKLAHGFSHYIATMASGYLLGNGITYEGEGLQRLKEAYHLADIQSVDAELVTCQSVYGKGVELVFANEEATLCSVCLPVTQAFVVYDTSVQNKPFFGVYLVQRKDGEGREVGVTLYIYTKEKEMVYHTQTLQGLLGGEEMQLVREAWHFMGEVPMVEYWNNENEAGDFEQVEQLIDAYDLLQSDRVNDKQQFVDAMLVLTGVRLEEDARGRSAGEQLRQDKILLLPDSDCKVEYLAKSMTEGDVEVLKNALKSDIHKFSLVPDLTDEHFSGNASGVAMRYKLLGLEQLTRGKERWFKEGLRQRMKCYAHYLNLFTEQKIDLKKATIVFTRSLPVNELEVAQTIKTYEGIVENDVLQAQVPFVQ